MTRPPIVRARCVRVSLTIAALAATACSDPATPQPEVASIELSVPDTGSSIRFRDPLFVRASPQAALGVPLARAVTWSSVTPSLLTVQPLNANGDSARIQAAGVGRGEVRVSAGGQSRTFAVTVQDTVFSVTLTPAALSLVVGDTVSFVASVVGPPNAVKSVEWVVTNATVLSTLDSLVRRVQVMASGVVSVRVTALADPTKSASAAVTAQVGKLVFVTQPSAVPREVPFNTAPTVEVHDAAGNRSARAANAITLSATGSCGGATSGGATVVASNGVAAFTRVTMSARCTAAVLTATASPAASPATSVPFAVTSRDCAAVVPFTVSDTLSALFEGGDCLVMRGGRQFYAHTYTLNVPATRSFLGFRLNTASDAFAPRVESYLWQQDPAVFVTDSLNVAGSLPNSYWLPPGSYQFVMTSQVSGGTGAYSRTTTFVTDAAQSTGSVPGCLIATTPGVSITSSLTGGECSRAFISRPGESPGRHFLLYLRPGKSIQVTYRPTNTASDNDAYLEVFDVTATSSLAVQNLVVFDDNSGGGVNGTDAQLTVQPATNGRFILVRTARTGGAGTSGFILTISP